MNNLRRQPIEFDMPVRRFVTKRLIGVDKATSIQEGVAKMVDFNISSLAVLEEEKVVGFFTDADIKERVVAQGRSSDEPVSNIMTTELITADINTTIREILEVMSHHKIKHILITEKEKAVGIITLRDLETMDRQKFETYIARE